jgi:hypothetical protein
MKKTLVAIMTVAAFEHVSTATHPPVSASLNWPAKQTLAFSFQPGLVASQCAAHRLVLDGIGFGRNHARARP